MSTKLFSSLLARFVDFYIIPYKACMMLCIFHVYSPYIICILYILTHILNIYFPPYGSYIAHILQILTYVYFLHCTLQNQLVFNFNC